MSYVSGSGSTDSFIYKQVATQPYPYINPLPYNLRKGQVKWHGIGKKAKKPTHMQAGDVVFNFRRFNSIVNSNGSNKSKNKALAKVDDELRLARSFFEDWYERKQAYAMLGSALNNLVYVTSALVRRDKRALKRYFKKKYKDADLSSIPDAWLAYNFGIKPLIGSIDGAVNILGKPFPTHKVTGASGYEFTNEKLVKYWSSDIYYTGNVIHKIGCTVTGINPNHLATNITGLNQPLAAVYNVLPWAWASDYFLQLDSYLQNFGVIHPGLEISGWYHTTLVKMDVAFIDYVHKDYKNGDFNFTISGNGVEMRRRLGRPAYEITWGFPALGTNSFANLTSALVGLFKGK